MAGTRPETFVRDELLPVSVVPVATDRLAVLCHYQPAAVRGIYLSQVLTVDHAGNWRDRGRFPWHGVDIAVRPSGEILVVGRDGQVGSIAGESTADGWLEEARAIGPMRGICAFGDDALAFGMNRHVYLSRGAGAWVRFESGFEPDDDGGEVDFDNLLAGMGGITALARSASGEFVAAGMNGEIWRSPVDAARWRPARSGVSTSLSAVFVDEKGVERACGQSGVLLVNGAGGWSRVAYRGDSRRDFTSAVATDRSILIADGHSLLRLKDGELTVVRADTPEILPCVKLSAGFGQVAGCSPKELFFARAGAPLTSLLGR
jgi:hypothetical protein